MPTARPDNVTFGHYLTEDDIPESIWVEFSTRSRDYGFTPDQVRSAPTSVRSVGRDDEDLIEITANHGKDFMVAHYRIAP